MRKFGTSVGLTMQIYPFVIDSEKVIDWIQIYRGKAICIHRSSFDLQICLF